jgi:hypothetical protein
VTGLLSSASAAALGAAVVAGVLVAGTTGPAAARDCGTTTLAQDIRKADVVFRGEVTTVRPVRGTGDQRTRSYGVQADRVYKSSLVTQRVTVTAAVGTPCELPVLKEGRRYIFFAREQGSQLLATPATAPAATALTNRVVDRLGDGVVPQPAPPATAEFTRVADARPPALSRLLAPGAALLILSLLGLLVVGRLGRRTT